MTTTYAIVADLHLGSTVALCKPVVNLDDGGSYHASKGQMFLWRSWENLLEQIDRRKTGDLITDLNGDICEGDFKDRSKQMISRNASTIKQLTTDTLDPLVKMSQGVFVKRGTVAHVGKSAEMEEEIALDIGALKCPETNTASWWNLRYICDGVKILSYHQPRGGAGGRPQNRFSSIDALASDTVFTYANDLREEPPDLVVCSHIHIYKDSFDHFRTRAITTPCWTLATEYVQRIAPGALPHIGGVLIFCSAGHYEVDVIRYEPAQTPFYSFASFQPNDASI